MTYSVPPPLFEGSGTQLWHAARALGDEPNLEWTFPAYVHRVLASSPHGLDLAYEYLQGWEQAVGFLQHEDLLAASDMAELLLTHRGMGIGVAVHDSFLESDTGVLDRPFPGDRFRGRHHVAVIGVTASNRLIVRNSWGDAWGRRGYGYVGRGYFEAYVEEVSVTYPAWIGWSPIADRVLAAASAYFKEPASAGVMAAAAATSNRIQAKTVQLGSSTLHVRMRRVMSNADGSLLDIVELRSQQDAFLARGHLLHETTARQGMIMELWVPPTQRRKGYGAALLRELIGLAESDPRLLGVTVPLFEADASAIGEGRARRFMDVHRFSWLGRGQERPPIRDFARRSFERRQAVNV